MIKGLFINLSYSGSGATERHMPLRALMMLPSRSVHCIAGVFSQSLITVFVLSAEHPPSTERHLPEMPMSSRYTIMEQHLLEIDGEKNTVALLYPHI